MKKYLSLIIVMISILFGGLFFYAINLNLNIKEKELQNSIKLTCGELYRYSETHPNGSVTTYPMEKEYKDCLKGN